MPQKLLTIIKREYLVRARTKGFFVFTVLIPALAAGFIFLEFQIFKASADVSSRLAVVDLSQKLYPQLAGTLDGKLANGAPQYILTNVAATPATLPAVRNQLSAEVLGGQLDAYVVIPAEVLQSRTAEYHVRNAAAVQQTAALEGHLREAVNRARMEAAGIPASQISQVIGGFDLHQLKVTATGDKTDTGETAIAAWVLVIMLYMFLLLYGIVVMKSVTEEKTTRISEILLSSVDAFSLMLGKIIGVAAVALTQFLVWGACFALFSAYSVAMAAAMGNPGLLSHVPHISGALFGTFCIFFILGFMVYASLYAAIGAVVSSDQEAQQTQLPLTMVLVVAFYCAFLVMNNPNAPISVGLSLVPFFAPILMTMRVAVSNPPLWQVVAAMVLDVLTFLVFTKLTAKIYRVSILMTGKRPNLPELMRWLKYA